MGLSLGLGCARSEPLRPTDASSSASKQEPPFHPDTDHASGVQSAASFGSGLASGLPFRSGSHSRVLPSGTLLTVQLEGLLSSATVRTGDVRAGDTFTAFVAAPLTIDGETLIERGAAVTGLVESTQSRADSSSGYFRLTLTAITVAGRQIALHTSSLFAREAFQQAGVSSHDVPQDLQSDVRVQKGRRLTFRLTTPVTLDNPNSVANRQYPGSTTE